MSTELAEQRDDSPYADEPSARRAPWLLVGGAGLLVLGLVAGVTYGVGQLSGGGAQPEEALPAGAFGFVKVDLDPPAGQKIDGFRFLRKFPALRERLGTEDLREVVFDVFADGVGGWDDVDFDSQVAPWMGKRIGIAAYPPPETDDVFPDPTVVVAVQVTDAAQAQQGLERLADLEVAEHSGPGTSPRSAGRLGFVVTGDYALLAETQKLADKAAHDAEASQLADDETLASDLAAAGDGVSAAWLDMDAAVEGLGRTALGFGGLGGITGGLAGGGGRSTYVAGFDGPDVLQVTGQVTGADSAGWATHPVEGVTDLPASSILAVGLADGDELVPRAFESLRKAFESAEAMPSEESFDEMVAGAEQELGLELPDDLATLLGDNLVAALDAGSSDSVEVGARVSTDVARAERVLDALQAGDSGDWVLTHERVGDDLVFASTPKQASRLAEDGTLGEMASFRAALPDVGEADAAVWLDVKGLWTTIFAGFSGDEMDENIEPIDGVGLTVTSRDQGNASLRLRLVAH